MADNMPDFDKMSPEEIMAWMETLAKRQGASEGFTTTADMSVAEIDPNSVVIDEPGYVPYDTKIGSAKPTDTAAASAQTAPPPPAPQQTQPPARTAPPTPPPTREVPPPPPTPARTTPPTREVPPVPSTPARTAPPPTREVPPPPSTPARTNPPTREMPPAPSTPARTAPPTPPPSREVAPPPSTPARTNPPTREMPSAPSPVRDVPPPPPAASVPTPPPSTAPRDIPPPPPVRSGGIDEGALAWLENLASEQEDSLFNLDLSGVPAMGEASQGDSLSWLENLAATTTSETAAAEPAAEDDPFASGGNPIAWLERLAREQGAKPDEMTTEVESELELPTPDLSILGEELEPLPPQDPSNFLESLAAAEGYDEFGVSATRPSMEPEPAEADETNIEQAVASGTASREQMQEWLERQTDKYLESEEIEVEEFDPDAPAVPAELPSWLVESFGMPPTAEAAAPDRPSLESLFPTDDTETAGIPDWLHGDTGSSAAMDMESIFAEDEATIPAPLPAASIDAPPQYIDEEEETEEPTVAADSWAEAFDDEYAQGAVDIDNVPDWYQRNLSDPTRVAAVEQMAKSTEPLPEEDRLPLGQPQAVPDWMVESVVAPPAPPFEDAAAQSETMDWMEGLEAAVSPDEIPAWLLETIDEPGGVSGTDILAFDMEAEAEPPAPAPTPQPAAAPVREPQPQPAPVRTVQPPVRAPAVARADVSLTEARRLSQAGSLAEGLAHYEGLIRAMVNVDDVVDDLSSLSRQYRDNPSIFRLLGDGLMRQGNLQAALDTYRQALNQL